MSIAVSVVIPCYKQAHFLPECIASLQAQTMADWEAIIVDDGSPDDTAQVAERLSAGDARVRLVRKGNGGLSSARNAGLRVAVGDWVQFLDADDLLLPRKLEVHLAHAEKLGHHTCVFGSAWYFKDQNTDQRTKAYLCNGEDIDWIAELAADQRPMLERLIERNQFPVCSPFLSRHLLASVGVFDEALRAAEDWQMWLRCAVAGLSWHFVSEPSAAPLIRVHSASMTQEPHRMIEGEFNMRCSSLRFIPQGPLRLRALQFAINASEQLESKHRNRRLSKLFNSVDGFGERFCVVAAALFRRNGVLYRRAYRLRSRIPDDLRDAAGI